MLIDDIRQQLTDLQPDIATITAYWHKSGKDARYISLKTQSELEEFWKNPEGASLLKELQALKNDRDQFESIVTSSIEIPELIELFSDDQVELALVQKEVYKLKKAVASFKIALLLSQAHDQSDCFVNINAGAGGTESQDWANMLLRMYMRFCEQHKLKTLMIDFQPAEEAGIKSATLFVQGKNAYGLLKSERGIHRLVRISPFDANKRRHTSFAAVMVTPEMPDIDVSIDPKDLRIDTYRSGGAGGQHVNTTDSAVRITHIPTGLVAQCQNERSQGQNKDVAMKMLRAKVAQKMIEEEEAKRSAGIEKKKMEWGSQIRSYVLHPYKMVKDHRTNYESPQPDLVLDGDLMEFIESFLVWQAH